MTARDQERIDKFKALIRYDEKLPADDPDRGVVLSWPDPRNWQIAADTTIVNRDTVLRKWDLVRGDQALTATMFVSSAGPGPAAQYLLEVASNTMMLEIPYKPGPEGLGDLAVEHANPNIQDLIWVFRNVCVRIEERDRILDASAVARWLQKEMEGQVVAKVSEHRPQIEEVRVSSQRVRVGETFTVEVAPAAGEVPKQLLVELEQEGDALDLVAENGLTLQLAGQKVGRAGAQVVVADAETLLCTTRSIRVDVVEPEQSDGTPAAPTGGP